MIKLNDYVTVKPDDISKVIVAEYSEIVTVIMRDGSSHEALIGYGEGKFKCRDRIISEIERKLAK